MRWAASGCNFLTRSWTTALSATACAGVTERGGGRGPKIDDRLEAPARRLGCAAAAPH